MNEKKFRVCLVGCGVISENHLTALSALPSVTVVALCDKYRSRAEAAAKAYAPGAASYTDYEAMLDAERPDAVHICTPHFLHAPMACAALRRGINVFLEKPMATSVREIEEIREAERASRGRVCVCFQNRFNNATLTAKAIADEDGGALTACGTVFWHRDDAYYAHSEWRGRMETEGGGVLINQAIHTLDMLSQFLGRPEYVQADIANRRHRGIIDVEDTASGIIDFPGGRQGQFFATTTFPGGDLTEVTIKTKNHCMVLTTSRLTLDGEVLTDATAEHYIGKPCYGAGHTVLIEKFYTALKNGDTLPVGTGDSAWALELLKAAYASRGEKIPVQHARGDEAK